jgi:hypothetical protein
MNDKAICIHIVFSRRARGLRELAQQLESAAAVTVWSEGAFVPGQTIIESLTEIANRSDFAVFILSTDQPDHRFSSLSNQSFELGYFAGRLGLSRTFVLVPEGVSLPTDLTGIMYIPLSTRSTPDLKAAIARAAAVIRKEMSEINTRHEEESTQYYSCFISYSWEDQGFARRLHDDLSDVGVRTWLDAKDLKIRDRWPEIIAKAIQVQDKVLLVLSRASIQSAWVQEEVKNALRLERSRGKTVLFPIRLDDAIFEIQGNPEIDSLKERQIGDFRDWGDKTRYRRAFSQLVRDLAISASVESVERS